jgi:hypothetical protein
MKVYALLTLSDVVFPYSFVQHKSHVPRSGQHRFFDGLWAFKNLLISFRVDWFWGTLASDSPNFRGSRVLIVSKEPSR